MPEHVADAEAAEPPSSSTNPATRTLVVPARFCGPPRSANGGYVSSRVASYVGVTSVTETAPHGIGRRAVATRLRAPVPLDTSLDVAVDGDQVTLRHDGTVIAEAMPGELDVDPLEPVGYLDAVSAGRNFVGYTSHPMPTCFGCGTERAPGDGLRLAVGDVGDGRVAAAWEPDLTLLAPDAPDTEIATEFAWTVLDCTAAWTWDFAGEPALLGTMTGILDEAPYVGDRCVAVAAVVGRDGRKIRTASALYDNDGRVLGRAQSTWITVDPARIRGD